MSIFASQTAATIPIPFDQPHTVTIRTLTGREVEAAQLAHATSVAAGGARHWAARFRRLLEKAAQAGQDATKVTGMNESDVLSSIQDPLTGFDRYALLAGLTAWTYPTPITEPSEREAAFGDLVDDAVEFFATEILRKTKPALFATSVEDAETIRKNG